VFALVTGGHGFVGSHLVARLLERGDRVRCLYRRPGRPAALEGLDVEIVPGDVREAAALDAALDGVDEVHHLAALTRSRTRAEMLRTNAGGTLNLLAAARRARLAGRFVFCSSQAAAGPSPVDRPLVETDPARPITWYGESKRLGEVATLACRDRLEVTVIRPPAVYGPRDVDFLALFKAAARGFAPLLGTVPRRYSFVYAADLAEGMLRAARSPVAAGRTYFVSNDAEALTTEELVAHVGRAVGRRGRTVRVPESALRLAAGVGEVVGQLTGRPPLVNRQRMIEASAPAYLCSAAALARDVGFRASTNVAEGTVLTARWYREHGWI
jgi:nucleoside-diphosphate-sugar epimerase